MSLTADLLIELFSEEIPARMQFRAAEDFKRLFAEHLQHAEVSVETLETFVSPRRLILQATGFPLKQQDRTVEKRGPRVDAPAKAIEGFLKSVNLKTVADCEQRETPKGTFLFASQHIAGQKVTDLLPDLLNTVIEKFPWPKVMRWGQNTLPWVRPLHSIICLFDNQIVPGTLDLAHDKITYGATTWGHRFMAREALTMTASADYQDQLERAFVIVDQNKRQQLIEQQLNQITEKTGLQVHPDQKLLEEVTGLVEWPHALLGKIEPKFMSLPKEVLMTSMRVHQKYFALESKNGELAPHFIVVANIDAKDQGAQLIQGNERVLRARLADAQFFYDQDLKQSLESYEKKLSGIVFHAQQGTMAQKSQRLIELAKELVPHTSADSEHAQRAARLCKNDLLTEMVGEFPELQGIMGRYYALHSGEPEPVAQAIADHYKPKGPQDALAKDAVGDTVALADKLDTLVGFFSVGIHPSGAKDPYALRRTALGLIRIAERHESLNIFDHLEAAYDLHAQTNLDDLQPKDRVLEDVQTFILDRLKVYWRDHGQRHDHIAAVFAVAKNTPLALMHRRILALQDLMQQNPAEATDLLAAYKRACNIVRIEEAKDHQQYSGDVASSLLTEPEEIKLHQSLATNLAKIQSSLADHQYTQSMGTLASLKPDIDAFFDKVLVNADEADVRANRLNMLALIRKTFDQIADFSQVEG